MTSSVKKKKDILAGITMPLQNIITKIMIKYLKMPLTETEVTPYVDPTLFTFLSLNMGLSAVLFTILEINPTLITVVQILLIYFK